MTGLNLRHHLATPPDSHVADVFLLTRLGRSKKLVEVTKANNLDRRCGAECCDAHSRNVGGVIFGWAGIANSLFANNFTDAASKETQFV